MYILEIRDHPFLMGSSLEEFQRKYPGKTVCHINCLVYLLLAIIILVLSLEICITRL